MREGYSKGSVKWISAAVSILCLLAVISIDASGQGGDGRPEDSPRKSFVRKKSPRSTPRVARKPTPRPLPPPKLLAPDLGTLAAFINESDSRVYLSSLSAPDPLLMFVTPRRQSVFWRMLEPGRYQLTVKKPGFFDETRTVEIDPRGRHRLSINLRPEMAILSLSTSISDAEIEVESVGTFKGSLKKHLVKPGRYRINVKRRGFVSQTVTAELTAAGKEQNIYVVLEPLPIDTVLTRANELLAKRDLDGASLLVSDVLLMNPAHARANMIFGFIEMKRGNSSSADYLLRAIRGGETVSIASKTVFENQLTDVQIALDRDAIAMRSAKRVELNFRITRPKLAELQRLVGAESSNYIAVKGESDFFGRGIRPNFKIFSTSSTFDPASGIVNCYPAGTCSADIEILFKVISGWRDMAITASKR